MFYNIKTLILQDNSKFYLMYDEPNEELEVSELNIHPNQTDALELLFGKYATLLYGNSRGGKTFIIVYFILKICMLFDPEMKGKKGYELIEAPRILIVRKIYNTLIKSVLKETFPVVASLMGLEKDKHYKINMNLSYIEFVNGAEIWLGGLDDSGSGESKGKRLDRVLGKEYFIIWPNEASDLGYDSYEILLTRLAQNTGIKSRMLYDDNLPMFLKKAIGWVGNDSNGNPIFDGKLSELGNRIIVDENPPSKLHWTYQLFILGVNPKDKTKSIPNHLLKYGALKMSAEGNDSLPPTYFEDILGSLVGKNRVRFYDGDFADAVQGALFSEENINANRRTTIPDIRRVVISIDPAVSTKITSDETGIIVVGEGVDNRGYVLEDASGKYSPKEWAEVAGDLFVKWDADCVVAEINQGGDLVVSNLDTYNPNIPVKTVVATKGKMLRAEPISNHYALNRVSHVGTHSALEDEMVTYTGQPGEDSPNRLDALVHGLTFIFPVGRIRSDMFSQNNLFRFSLDEDFENCPRFCFIKITQADNYNFSAVFTVKKDGKNFVYDVMFNNESPIYNLPDIIFRINNHNIKRIWIEIDPSSYSSFVAELKKSTSKPVRGAIETKDPKERILMEKTYIKDNFLFLEDLEVEKNIEYKLFLRQLMFYSNISKESDIYAANMMASASYISRIFP